MKLIVGIDPGTTTAIAILSMDIDSKFYRVFSKKEMSLNAICEYISGKGDPIIIATDVKKPPAIVKKVASAFSAVLFKPKRTITQSEKRKLIKSKLKSKHEKDALAAALLAKKRFSPLLRKIDSSLKKKSAVNLSDEVKELIIKHKAGNIEQAIRSLRSRR